jgi:signal transduction histidine kinase
VKFTEPNGAIVVSAKVLDDDMVITVSDNGIGIAEDKLSRIAEPFFQSNSNPHIAQEGTGLGLSIIKLLIEAHGGTLDIESQLGEGSTVTVRLPLSHAR